MIPAVAQVALNGPPSLSTRTPSLPSLPGPLVAVQKLRTDRLAPCYAS